MKMGMRVRLEESFRLSYFLFMDTRFFNIREYEKRPFGHPPLNPKFWLFGNRKSRNQLFPSAI